MPISWPLASVELMSVLGETSLLTPKRVARPMDRGRPWPREFGPEIFIAPFSFPLIPLQATWTHISLWSSGGTNLEMSWWKVGRGISLPATPSTLEEYPPILLQVFNTWPRTLNVKNSERADDFFPSHLLTTIPKERLPVVLISSALCGCSDCVIGRALSLEKLLKDKWTRQTENPDSGPTWPPPAVWL